MKIDIPEPEWTVEAQRVAFGATVIPVHIKFHGWLVFSYDYANPEPDSFPEYEEAEAHASAFFAERLARLLGGI